MDNNGNVTITYHDANHVEHNVKVRRKISKEDEIAYVRCVIDALFDDEGHYLPYMKSIAINDMLLRIYTNMKYDSISELCDLVDNTDLIQSVLEQINRDQYTELSSWIEESLDYEMKRSGLDRAIFKVMDRLSEKISQTEVDKGIGMKN